MLAIAGSADSTMTGNMSSDARGSVGRHDRFTPIADLLKYRRHVPRWAISSHQRRFQCIPDMDAYAPISRDGALM
jgi:hypothetical protein